MGCREASAVDDLLSSLHYSRTCFCLNNVFTSLYRANKRHCPASYSVSKKLRKSLACSDSDNEADSTERCTLYDVYEGLGYRILEVHPVSGIQSALQELCCKKCGSGPVCLKKDLFSRCGLRTYPYIFCKNCSVKILHVVSLVPRLSLSLPLDFVRANIMREKLKESEREPAMEPCPPEAFLN